MVVQSKHLLHRQWKYVLCMWPSKPERFISARKPTHILLVMTTRGVTNIIY